MMSMPPETPVKPSNIHYQMIRGIAVKGNSNCIVNARQHPECPQDAICSEVEDHKIRESSMKGESLRQNVPISNMIYSKFIIPLINFSKT